MLAGLASRDAALGEPKLLYLATVYGRAWPRCVGLGRNPGASATYLLRGWPWLRESGPYQAGSTGPYGFARAAAAPGTASTGDLQVPGDGGGRLAAGLPARVTARTSSGSGEAAGARPWASAARSPSRVRSRIRSRSISAAIAATMNSILSAMAALSAGGSGAVPGEGPARAVRAPVDTGHQPQTARRAKAGLTAGAQVTNGPAAACPAGHTVAAWTLQRLLHRARLN